MDEHKPDDELQVIAREDTLKEKWIAWISLKNLPWLRRIIVAVIGFTVLLVGVAMIVLPGPAILVIPLGLAILATEFVWAKRLLDKAKAIIARKETRKKKNSKEAGG